MFMLLTAKWLQYRRWLHLCTNGIKMKLSADMHGTDRFSEHAVCQFESVSLQVFRPEAASHFQGLTYFLSHSACWPKPHCYSNALGCGRNENTFFFLNFTQIETERQRDPRHQGLNFTVSGHQTLKSLRHRFLNLRGSERPQRHATNVGVESAHIWRPPAQRFIYQEC